jgi:hypothetical protein
VRTFAPEIEERAVRRLRETIPDVLSVKVRPAPIPMFSISFHFRSETHALRLRRENGLWTCREWIVDHAPRDVPPRISSPRFEALILQLFEHRRTKEEPVESATPPPRISVAEMRCPEDARRLFGKVVVQVPLKQGSPSNLIEFSCSQCKRLNGEVTMHYFDMVGNFVKTEALEPWIKQEPREWFGNNSATPRREVVS